MLAQTVDGRNLRLIFPQLCNRRPCDGKVHLVLIVIVMHRRWTKGDAPKRLFARRLGNWIAICQTTQNCLFIAPEWSSRQEDKLGAGVVTEIRTPSVCWSMVRLVKDNQIE